MMINSQVASAARILQVENGRNARFRVFVLGIALLVLIVLGAIILTLVDGSLPVFKQLGLSFFTSKEGQAQLFEYRQRSINQRQNNRTEYN